MAFNQIISELILIDIETTNGTFTWNNRRGGHNQRACCLDHLLISYNIMMGGWNLEVVILPTAGSGHWDISLNIDLQIPAETKPFRFEKFRLNHPNFADNIKKWWQETADTEGNLMYRFEQILNDIKACIKKKLEQNHIWEHTTSQRRAREKDGICSTRNHFEW